MAEPHPYPSSLRRLALSAPEAYAELAGLDLALYDLPGVLAEVADIARATLVADAPAGPGARPDGSCLDTGAGEIRGEVSLTLIRATGAAPPRRPSTSCAPCPIPPTASYATSRQCSSPKPRPNAAEPGQRASRRTLIAQHDGNDGATPPLGRVPLTGCAVSSGTAASDEPVAAP